MRIVRAIVAVVAAAAVVLVGPAPAKAVLPVPGDGYRIKLVDSAWSNNKCLNVRDEGTADLTPVQMYDCSLAWNNQWIFEKVGRPQDTGGRQAYRIKARHANKCLDVKGAAREEWIQLQIFTCGPQWNQWFLIDEVSWNHVPAVKLVSLYTWYSGLDYSRCVSTFDGHVYNLALSVTRFCYSTAQTHLVFQLLRAA